MKKFSLLIALSFLTGVSCWATEPLEKVAKDLAEGLAQLPKAHVAVLAVMNEPPRSNDGPALVSERLISYLARDRRVHLIERDQVLQILQEHHLAESGAMDPSAAGRIGKMLGADVIVTGTLIDLEDNKTEFNARALFADSGRVIVASRAVLERTWIGTRSLEAAGPHHSEWKWQK